MNSLLTGLNKEQQQAVQHTEGPLLILAGAGSGKTKVLTVRIAHLLAQGVNPYEILAITFTNKAAKEMKSRVEGLVGDVANRIWLSTFHSFCAKFLRFELDNFLGYNSNFTIYDTSDSQAVIKAALKALNLDDKYYPVGAMIGAISDAKNKLLFASDFRKQARDFYQQKVADVYEYYERELRKNNALDFDDLLLVAVKLLQSNEAVLDKYSKRFRYVMIDEYQDTNHAQYLLAKLLASHWKNIAVVGDADQSIYAWRGADIQNILDFEKDYPNCTSIKLEQNYRSTKIILDAANAVIENNEGRPKKNLWTDKTEGAKIQHFTAQSEHEEAAFIGDTIAKKHDIHGVPYGDMAILYRTNAQSRVLEEALIKRALPYTMVGGTKFYDRKEIKDVLAYLRVLYNPFDDLSLLRIINVPKRSIGATTVAKLQDYARANGTSLFMTLTQLHPSRFIKVRLCGNNPSSKPPKNTIGNSRPFAACNVINVTLDSSCSKESTSFTSAKKELYISNATTRTVFGRTSSYLPSRFIDEIPEELVDGLRAKRKVPDDIKRHVPQHMSVTSRPVTKPIVRNEVIADWKVGDTAIHSKWGNGKVINVAGEGAGMKLTIEFPTQGVRVVMAKFAPVKKG